MWTSRVLRLPRKPFSELDYARHMPEEYVKNVQRVVPRKVWGERFGAPPIVRWMVHPDDAVPSSKRPWEQDELQASLKRQNKYHEKKVSRKFLELRHSQTKQISDQDWTFFMGDQVEVLVGKDKGRQGTISRVNRATNEVYVDQMHAKLVTKFSDDELKRLGVSQTLIWEEQPLSVEKGQVKLVDPNDNQPCNASWKLSKAGDEWVRVSERTGFEIPIPTQAEMTYDYAQAEKYIDVEGKDTPADEVLRITFKPKLMAFEEEIMESFGIKENRQRKPTYWY
ncbi:unnamed protein product, partial [Mesorhabditis belari]|uniref:Large ribosomal subunit protein uL24m n=1 Tax=Mesorhabditis belari TaxID=2138241 RepID=A0AAF3FE49_9BILA